MNNPVGFNYLSPAMPASLILRAVLLRDLFRRPERERHTQPLRGCPASAGTQMKDGQVAFETTTTPLRSAIRRGQYS